MEPLHVPVLADAVLEQLAPAQRKGTESYWLDGTLGLGGHAEAVLEAAGDGARLVGVDRDPEALAIAGRRLARFGARTLLLHGNYADLPEADRADEIEAFTKGRGFDGILLDLGVSSLQLDRPERGFSFRGDGPLDMRMDPGAGPGASEWLEATDEAELAGVLKDFGEERQARRLARAVLRERDAGRLKGTRDLAALAERVLGPAIPGRIHPATRLFQALRIAVNGELEALERGLPDLARRLARDGRIAVISFHSLEDRRVKDFFRRESSDCVCPPGLPECRCGHHAWLETLTPRPIPPTEEESRDNPRSRSAKLRAARRTRMD